MTIELKPIILVVDCETDSLKTTSSVLTTADYEVLRVNTRAQAIAVSAETQLDMIICDLDIDQIDSYDLVEEIRQLPDRNDVPAMFASRHQLPDVVLKHSACGVSYHLRKPIDPHALLELVETALWLPHLVTSHVTKHEAEAAIKKPYFSIPAGSDKLEDDGTKTQDAETAESNIVLETGSHTAETNFRKTDLSTNNLNDNFFDERSEETKEPKQRENIAKPAYVNSPSKSSEPAGITTEKSKAIGESKTEDTVDNDDKGVDQDEIISRRYRPIPHFNLTASSRVNQNQ